MSRTRTPNRPPTPNAAPAPASPEAQANTVAQPFSPADALGGATYKENLVESWIPAGLTGDPRTAAKANAIADFDNRYLLTAPIASDVFKTAHAINNTQSHLSINRDLTTLTQIDAFRPGSVELIQLSKEFIENGTQPNADQQLFLDAMRWSSEAWKTRIEPQPVRLNDEQGNLDPNYYPDQATYDSAKVDATAKIISDLRDKMVAARADGNAVLAALHRQELQEMQKYAHIYLANTPPAPDQTAAKRFMHALNAKNQPGAPQLATTNFNNAKAHLVQQSEIDEIYSKCDRLVKAEMRRELDKNEAQDVAAMESQLEAMTDGLGKGYKSKRTILGKGGRVDRRAYDILVGDLVELKTRMEARKHNDTKADFDENAFINQETSQYFGKVSEKTAGEHEGSWKGKKGLRGIGRAALNMVTGRKSETGAKVSKGKEKYAKIGVRVITALGVLGAGALTGGLSIVAYGAVAYAVDKHINKDAEANAALVQNKTGGLANPEKALEAIKGAGTRREKIRAATQANREAHEELAKEVVKKAMGRATFTAITVGGATLFVLSPAEEWIAKGVMNVWDAGAGIIENMNDIADGKMRNEIREAAYATIN